MTKLSTYLIFMLAITSVLKSHAQLYLNENFSYISGTSINGQGSWTAFQSAGIDPILVSSSGLTYAGYGNSGIGNGLQIQNVSGEDVRANISSLSIGTGSVYAGFLINVSSASPTPNGSVIQFDGGGTNLSFRQSGFILRNSSGNLQFGLFNDDNLTPTYSSTPRIFGITYFIVVEFNNSTGSFHLYVNPIIDAVKPAADVTISTGINITSITRFGFLQKLTGVMVVDGVRISPSWNYVVSSSPTGNAGSSTVSLPVYETFEYSQGQVLTEVNPGLWSAFAQAGVNPVTITPDNLTYSNYTITGSTGAIPLFNSRIADGEDVKLTFATTSQPVVASFLIKIQSQPSGLRSPLCNFNGSGSLDFSSTTVDIRLNTNNYSINFSGLGGASELTLSYGATHLIVVKYNPSSRAFSLFIDNLSTTEPATPSLTYTHPGQSPFAIDGFNLYQQNLDDFTIFFDALHLGNSWTDVVLTDPSIINLIRDENFEYAGGTAINTQPNWSGSPSTSLVQAGSLSYQTYGSSGVGNMLSIPTSTTATLSFPDRAPNGSIYTSLLIPPGGLTRVYYSGSGNCGNFQSFSQSLIPITPPDGPPTLVVLELDFTAKSYYYYINPLINETKPTPTETQVGSWGSGCLVNINAVKFMGVTSGSLIDGIRISDNWSSVVGIEEPPYQPAGFISIEPGTTSNQFYFQGSSDLPTGYLVLRKPVSPVSAVPGENTLYNSGEVIGDATVISSNSSTSITDNISVTPETNFFYSIFSMNSANGVTKYRVASPLTFNFFTYSLEPGAAPATFSATGTGSTQIDLAFSASSSITNADGFLILRRQDGTFPTNSGITDGMAPGSLALPAGTTLVTTITNSSATSFSDANLTASSIFYYTIIPYNYDGANNATYNYYTLTLSTTSALTRPSPPSISVASNISSNSFNANWSASEGATGYFLDVSSVIDFSTFVTGYNNLSVGNVTTFSVANNIIGNTTYYYRVRAANTSGSSTSSSPTSFTTAPAAPNVLTASLVTNNSFNANWSASIAATNYFLDVSTSNTFSSFVAGYNNLSVGNVTSHAVNMNLSANTTYYYRLRAANTNGGSVSSSSVTVTTAPDSPVVSGASSITQTSFSANWASSASATGYLLDVSTDNFAGPTYVAGYINLSVGNVTSFSVVTNLSAGTIYYYRVRATNTNGTSGNSGIMSVLTRPPDPVASIPDPANVTDNSFAASWTASASATDYQLDVSTDNSFSNIVYQNLSLGDVLTAQVNTGLSGNTLYYFRLWASNTSGQSNNSATVSFTTAPVPPAVSATTSVTDISFNANWSASTGATGYFLDVSASNLFASFVTSYNNVSVGNVTSYAVNTNLAANTIYYCRLRSTNANGTSRNSSAFAITTAPPPPVVAEGTAVTNNSFNANWSASASATGYFLDVSVSSTFASFLTGFNNLSIGNVTSYSVSANLTSNTTYYYRIRSTNLNGTSNNSASMTVSTAPSPPVASVATIISDNAFNANWSASSAATGYFLDASTDNFSSFLTGYNGKPLTLTSETISGLFANTTYQYRVRATNSSGTSANSNTTTVLTLSTAPEAIAATAITQTGFTANWNSIAGVTDFILDVSTDDFATRVIGFDNLLVTGTSKAVAGLNPGITYKYRLRASNASGASENSNLVSIITVAATPIADAASSVSQQGFTIKWNLVTGADNYLLDVSSVLDFSSFLAGYNAKSLPSTVTSEAVSGLASGTTYYYRLRSANKSGESSNSTVISQVTVPADPLANTVVTKNNNSFFASWNTVQGATSYELDVSLFNANFATFVSGYNAKLITTGNTEDLVTGLLPQTAYSFRVRAINEGGKSGNSNTKTMITDAAPGGPQTVFTVTLTNFNNGQFSGGDVNIQGQISNGVGTVAGTLVYKGITEAETKEKSITITNDTYSVLVNETMLDELGIEFFVKVRDETDAEKITGIEKIYRAFSAAGSPSVVNSNFEGTRASIKIISIPYDLKDNLIESIFSSLGVYDKKGWRLAHYLEGQGNVEYKEGINKIERGLGYWFNAKKGLVNIKSGEGSVGFYTQTNPFKLSLVSGWNQIGNPYPFDIDWTDVIADNPTASGVGTLKVYNASNANYSSGNKMEPFTGGFVHSENNMTLDVQVSLNGRANGGREKDNSNFDLGKDSWRLPLIVKQNSSVYDLGVIGMEPMASFSKDSYDEIRLPRLEEYLDITFEHPENRFSYFTQDIIPSGDEASWEFYVGSNMEEPHAKLEWDNSGFGNSPAKLWLLDVSSVRWVDMSVVNSYSFTNPGTTRFRIYFSGNGHDIIPDVLMISHPFPNPVSTDFRLSLTLPERGGHPHKVAVTLVDLLGNPVNRVFEGEVNSGFHTIKANTVDFSGNNLTSGIYMLRTTINGQSQFNHKLIINK